MVQSFYMSDCKNLLNESWAKFPYIRPLNQQSVLVLINGVKKCGRGVNTPRYPIEKI